MNGIGASVRKKKMLNNVKSLLLLLSKVLSFRSGRYMKSPFYAKKKWAHLPQNSKHEKIYNLDC